MKDQRECLVCKRDAHEIPVTKFYYKGSHFYICAQHMPVIIHDPQKLIGLIPGADKMQGA
jgi:hypothetical protein